jgi:hypothetical protein
MLSDLALTTKNTFLQPCVHPIMNRERLRYLTPKVLPVEIIFMLQKYKKMLCVTHKDRKVTIFVIFFSMSKLSINTSYIVGNY